MNPYSFNVELYDSKDSRNAGEAGKDLPTRESRNVSSSKKNPLLCFAPRIWKNISSPKVVAAAAVGIFAFSCGRHLVKKAAKRLRKSEHRNDQPEDVVKVSKVVKTMTECADASKDLEERSKRTIDNPMRCAAKDATKASRDLEEKSKRSMDNRTRCASKDAAKSDPKYDPFLAKDLVALLRRRSASLKLEDLTWEKLGFIGPEKPIEETGKAQAKGKVAKTKITFEKGVQTECDDKFEKRENRKKNTGSRSTKGPVPQLRHAKAPCESQNHKAIHGEVSQMLQLNASDLLSWIFNPEKAPPKDFEFTVTFKSLGPGRSPFISVNDKKPND